MDTSRPFKVFVSSTSEDLLSYRAVARLAVLDTGWLPVMMEHFGTLPDSTVEACTEKLGECDVVLLIVAFRRGWVPTAEQGGNDKDSITGCELAFARKKRIPVLAMLASETWPGNLWEKDQAAREWVQGFRSHINLPAVFFEYEKELASPGDAERLPLFRAKVKEALTAHHERILAATLARPEIDYFDRARSEMLTGKSIPFLGLGVYGDGPLSTASLTRDLGTDACGDQKSLATAGEYCERFLDSRASFLEKLEQVIQGQEQQLSSPPSVYNLILKTTPSPLIVSFTCDWVLEGMLERAGLPYALVCHVIRSAEGTHDGKILVLQDKKVNYCLADKLACKETTYLIYKPLGSPFIHRLCDPELEIDTVVLTESDHLLFLSRLENENTQVPTRFSRLLQRVPLLFLGYTLDVWQYRLVMQVLQTVGQRGGHFSSIAVREAASTMERLAWTQLGSRLVHSNPNDFARRVEASIAKNVIS